MQYYSFILDKSLLLIGNIVVFFNVVKIAIIEHLLVLDK